MKTFLQILAVAFYAQCALAQDSTTAELNRITAMTVALDGGGIAGFLDQTSSGGWKIPHIPSQWHVEHVAKPEEKQIDVAARVFGKALAKRLADESATMQRLPADDSLYTATVRLLDLSEWCAAVDGYGNAFLAQRCLDLAAVGVARLTANLDFPLEQCEVLLGRMQPAWLSAETNLRILNKDAGAVIFTTADREEMERVMGSGNIARRMKANPTLNADLESRGIAKGLRRSKAIDENLAFFDDTEAGQMRPPTLVNTWDKKTHGALVVGLELQSIEKARALIEFRKKIGAFPEKPDFSEEQISMREKRIAESASQGIKISRFEDAYRSPMAAAFAQAWRRYLESETSNVGNLPRQHQNLDAAAFQAYDEIRRHAFLDHDSAAEQQTK